MTIPIRKQDVSRALRLFAEHALRSGLLRFHARLMVHTTAILMVCSSDNAWQKGRVHAALVLTRLLTQL